MAPTTQQTELHRILGRMEGKMDGIVAVVTGLHSDHKELNLRLRETEKALAEMHSVGTDHDILRKRMAVIEKRVYQWSGASALASPIILAAIAAAAKAIFA